MRLLENDFYFMRHGMTASNDSDRIAGFTDEPLTSAGKALAARQAAKLAGLPLGSLWVSTLARARQTAAAVLTTGDAPLFLLDELRERNWGEMEGRPRSELNRATKPHGGEGPEEFRDRTRAGLARITGPAPVLIVAHSGTAREIFALLDLAFERPDNCDILHFQRDKNCHWIVKKL